jgi:hypothetical protein
VKFLFYYTNQAAIIALFRVMNRYVGNLPPMPGVFPDYPAPVVRKCRRRVSESYHDALGHAAPAARRRFSRHQHPKHHVASLARLVEAGKPLPGSGQQLRRVCA